MNIDHKLILDSLTIYCRIQFWLSKVRFVLWINSNRTKENVTLIMTGNLHLNYDGTQSIWVMET